MQVYRSVLSTTLLLGSAAAGFAATPVLNNGSFVSKPEQAEQGAICPTGKGYPAQFTWSASGTTAKPGPATTGTAKIEQYRDKKLIATYTSFVDKPGCTYKADGTDWENPGPPAASGCGPFTHVKGWRLWAPSDVFLVYPAVYNGQYNNFSVDYAYDGPADYPNNPTYPQNILIQGVVQNNVRPVVLLDVPSTHNAQYQAAVYFGGGTNNTMQNIDIMEGAGGSAAVSGVYVSGSENLQLNNVRISGFQQSQLDGLFVATAGGYLYLNQVEIDHNGGNNNGSLGHGAYVNASTTDPAFNIIAQNSWFHDIYLGSLFKTRATRGAFTGNYFEGGLPQKGATDAENYLLDIPNGGNVAIRNNIFVKNESGPDTNGAAITFGVEGVPDSRTLYLDIENNTFVAFSAYFTGASGIYPLEGFNPPTVPGQSGWPSNAGSRILKNVFVGYCPYPNNPVYAYRGNIDVQEAFSELNQAFAITLKLNSNEAVLEKYLKNYVPVVGTVTYQHQEQPGVKRTLPTIGAED